ncbi:MAG TPA: LPS export ABC transporter permease LptF [Geminicoccaceae bacterium]|nr:LPS export ABC transporter permease LptF [Geminicoccaceae bacterium]
MAVLHRYLLAQIARPMVATVVVALLVLLAERMLRVVDLVAGWRGSLLVVFEILSYLIPHYIGLALPAAFFIGILVTLGRFSREGELDAMTAAGFGLPQLVRPLLVFSLLLMLVNLALVSYVQPYSRYAYRAAVHAVTSASFQQLLRENVFTTLGGTTSMVEEIGDEKRRFGGVFIYNRSSRGDEVAITAREGTLLRDAATDPIRIDLEDGVHQLVPAADPDRRDRTPDAVVARFRHFETVIFDAGGADFRPRGEHERELTLPELFWALDAPPPGLGLPDVQAEFHGRVARCLSVPLLPFLAVPLALGRRRSQASYGLAIGMAVLIAYNQVLGFGESLADNGRIHWFLGLWVPFLLFAALSFWLFARAAFRVPRLGGPTWPERAIDRLVELAQRLLGVTGTAPR